MNAHHLIRETIECLYCGEGKQAREWFSEWVRDHHYKCFTCPECRKKAIELHEWAKKSKGETIKCTNDQCSLEKPDIGETCQSCVSIDENEKAIGFAEISGLEGIAHMEGKKWDDEMTGA